MATSPLKEYEERRAIADTIRQVANQYGSNVNVDQTKLTVRPAFAIEITGNNKEISSSILEIMFPREPSPANLVHFTSLGALESIAASNEIRLYSVSKRVNEGELFHFAKDQGFKGYTDASDTPPFL